MELYILRHGQTDFNRLGIVQGSGVNSDLNEIGRKQAKLFFDSYKDVAFDFIVTSKLKRTHQTIHHFLERKTAPWLETADINEINWGDQEGQVSTPESRALYRSVVEEWENGNYHPSFPNGENALQLAERVQRFVEWVRVRPARRMLVCTHGRTMRCLVSLMKDLPLSNMEQGVKHDNTGLFLAKVQKNGKIVFERENCLSHLEK